MIEADYVKNEDYAYLLLAMGCCQLKLEDPDDAARSFDKALQTYLDVIDEKGNMSSFTSAIVGIITITDVTTLVSNILGNSETNQGNE